jgi:hypothetical protein
MDDHGLSLNRHCPCTQEKCAIHGNCVLCVQNHLERGNHLPECMQDLLRDKVEALAGLMQLTVEEGRPTPEHWQGHDFEKQVASALARHRTTEPDDTA